jgi:hypothetical protein
MEEEQAIRGRCFLMACAIVVVLMLSSCKTEYYENGTIKSDGFNLGTTGKGNYSLISFEVSGKEQQ